MLSILKKPLLAVTFLMLANYCMGQNSTVERVIERQLEAYNGRDIEAFMALFDEDAELYNHANGQQLAKGKVEIHGLYDNLFNQSPKLKSILKNRMVLGNTVIDHESITGRMGQKEAIELIVIYELKALKITKVTVIR